MKETRKGKGIVLRRVWSIGVKHIVTDDPDHAILFTFQDQHCIIEVSFDPSTAEVLIQNLKSAIAAFEAWSRSR